MENKAQGRMAEVLSFIQQNPGLNHSEIRKKTAIPSVSAHITKLQQIGCVRAEGPSRNHCYYYEKPLPTTVRRKYRRRRKVEVNEPRMLLTFEVDGGESVTVTLAQARGLYADLKRLFAE